MNGHKRIMSGEENLALRRTRMANAPAILRGGFRPFFLLAALWSIAALTIWLLALAKGDSPVAHLDATVWHQHEMLFGFVGAAIAGFILTAVPNWTGRLPIAGWPLAALALGWLAARLLPLLWVGPPMVFVMLDAGFYVILAALILREILVAGNRNLPAALLILIFGIADAAHLALSFVGEADPAIAIRGGLAVAIMLLCLIGGRIIPSFTRNWMMKAGRRENLPVQPDRFDRLVLVVTAITLATFTVLPSVAMGVGLMLVAALQLARLGRWRGWQTAADPLVAVLHVGYLWIPVGLGLLGASTAGTNIPVSAAVHALTAGAMATMILAVMSRATLGHTGRPLHADMMTVLSFFAITIAALLRVAASLGWGDYAVLMHGSAAAWIAAFGLFLLRYGPMLLTARIDGRP